MEDIYLQLFVDINTFKDVYQKEITIKNILKFLNRKEKNNLLMLFFMMIVAAIFETIGIGMDIPFVGIVTNPSMIKEHVVLSYIYKLFNFPSTTAFVIFSVICLLAVFVLKNLY